jgi:hypothetical protein
MVSPPRDHHRPISEEKRERDVLLLYGAAFRDILHLHEVGPDLESCSLPSNHRPQPSQDSALMALAQLATFRLGAGRAMISLIDNQRQYILAEATPNMPIHPQTSDDSSSTLWLGSVSIPRTWASAGQTISTCIVLTFERYVNFLFTETQHLACILLLV